MSILRCTMNSICCCLVRWLTDLPKLLRKKLKSCSVSDATKQMKHGGDVWHADIYVLKLKCQHSTLRLCPHVTFQLCDIKHVTLVIMCRLYYTGIEMLRCLHLFCCVVFGFPFAHLCSGNGIVLVAVLSDRSWLNLVDQSSVSLLVMVQWAKHVCLFHIQPTVFLVNMFQQCKYCIIK